MTHTKIYSDTNKPTEATRKHIAEFLFNHLENFGDPLLDIEKSISYALKENNTSGGFILVAYEEEEILGAVVLNKTGMKGYIPENILVYIATHNQHRGKGLGRKLIEITAANAKGDIALHVEPDNPAKYLYEKTGFSNKYLEMRMTQNN
ncbi:MAG: GNAT family N-acetyltransferase [Marinifilaceae bacterium]|jgi:GNAT superfamily N-acetyltransferase|nr:GNAT family N-acetyltransferase [Marinifilaceae bacterium]